MGVHINQLELVLLDHPHQPLLLLLKITLQPLLHQLLLEKNLLHLLFFFLPIEDHLVDALLHLRLKFMLLFKNQSHLIFHFVALGLEASLLP